MIYGAKIQTFFETSNISANSFWRIQNFSTNRPSSYR